MSKKDEFKPYISSDKTMPEFTPTSIITGLLLAVIFGAANAYLGLRIGMTVSASIPAAVIGMFVIKAIMRKNSVLESNMIQTIGSAGESLAAGAIFTMPALFLWAAEGLISVPGMTELFLIALSGGLLGVLFMVPLRKALIVKEHGVLPYPEGTACSEVILAGEKEGEGASSVFIGIGIAAIIKFIVDGLHIVKGTLTLTFDRLHSEISTEIFPAIVSVGYICGFKISSYIFAGGILGWLVLIPAIYLFGADATLYPVTDMSIAELWSTKGAAGIWSNYIKYIGAGAIATGGIISLVKTFPLLVSTFAKAIKGTKNSGISGENKRTDKDLKMSFILVSILIIIILIAAAPAIPVDFIGAVLIIVFGFFFATVSSRMVGLVGSSNNPVSGMAIATLLFSTVILKMTGHTTIAGMTGAIAIGSVICIIAAMAGDTSQDLKTGYILGATPWKQQIGEILGTVIAAFSIGGILYILNEAWGFGSAQIPAPQATLMKMIVEGVMNGNLPWNLVFIGAFIAIFIEILRIPVMPFAIGLYLPIELSACITIGSLIRLFVERRKYSSKERKERVVNGGILCCSGMIAGEGLAGVLLAILAVFGISADISDTVNFGTIGGIIVLIFVILSILKFSIWSKQENKE